jgi:hypothetical protein|tara:strand:+ start:330 stop:449 length:120 start_codon:yes stop_codon:yes gene_type:complete
MKSSDEFKWDALAQITEQGYPEFSLCLGVEVLEYGGWNI